MVTLDSYFKPKKRNIEELNEGKTTSNELAAKKVLKATEDKNDSENDKVQLTPDENDGSRELTLEERCLHESWRNNLKAELSKPYFIKLKAFLETEKKSKVAIFPPEDLIYNWSNLCPLNKVKVVIIGQDPYHNDKQAMGLAFGVPKDVAIPPSLINIFQELQKDIPTFERPKHGSLEGWAAQGVLLLNAVLTVRAHQPASHGAKGWELFTDAVINLCNSKDNLVFMLWGNYAQKKGSKIDKKKHLVLKSVHPSPLSAHRGFFGSKHFSQANEYLRSKGKREIDWSKTETEGLVKDQ